MPRKSFDIKDKRNAIQKIDALVSAGFSQHQACLGVGIPPLYYRRWVKVLKKVDVMNAGDVYVSNKTNGTARRIHPGQKSILAGIGSQLNRFIFQMREQGIHLTNRMVSLEASQILPAFQDKTTRAKELAAHRFTKSVGLMQCVATHMAKSTTQKPRTMPRTSLP